jgi:hypothetical protein
MTSSAEAAVKEALGLCLRSPGALEPPDGGDTTITVNVIVSRIAARAKTRQRTPIAFDLLWE